MFKIIDLLTEDSNEFESIYYLLFTTYEIFHIVLNDTRIHHSNYYLVITDEASEKVTLIYYSKGMPYEYNVVKKFVEIGKTINIYN